MTAALACLREAGMPFRWLRPEAMHLTLAFLGEVAENAVAAIDAALRITAAEHAPFPVTLRDVGAFPDFRRPNVLWMGMAPSDALHALHRDVAAALEPLGFPPERRVFHPHITLARTQNDTPRSAFGALGGLAASVRLEATTEVTAVDLMRSHLSRAGARYERVSCALLSGRRSP